MQKLWCRAEEEGLPMREGLGKQKRAEAETRKPGIQPSVDAKVAHQARRLRSNWDLTLRWPSSPSAFWRAEVGCWSPFFFWQNQNQNQKLAGLLAREHHA